MPGPTRSRWRSKGWPSVAEGGTPLLDELLPRYDVSDTVACVVGADAPTTWNALIDTDLIEVGRRCPAVGALGAVRAAPELALGLLRGELPPPAPKHLRLRELTDLPASGGGWILLGERPGKELALGLVGKFWRPVIEYAEVAPDDFCDFDRPGWAKTVYDLRVTPIDDATTLLTGTMRTATTTDAARKWFRRYWTLGVGSGAHMLVDGLLDTVRAHAEAAVPAGAAA